MSSMSPSNFRARQWHQRARINPACRILIPEKCHSSPPRHPITLPKSSYDPISATSTHNFNQSTSLHFHQSHNPSPRNQQSFGSNRVSDSISQMGRNRKPSDPEHTRYASLILLVAGVVSCALAYSFLSIVLKPDDSSSFSEFDHLGSDKDVSLVNLGAENDECCRGIEHLELWGAAVKWGSEFRHDTAEQCCKACKGMCSGDDGPCLCNSWVFCGNKEACGPRFGECWLKKQKDTMNPERQDEGQTVMWTSGIIFGKGEGIVGMETEFGTIRIKLYPDCAPRSVAFILELIGSRHCAGCQLHRAESRGQSWDALGNHIKDASFGPPYGLIQGTLEAQGVAFKSIPVEACPTLLRGSVAWIGPGPEFFISLANHQEWKNTYTVFGSVLPEDMEIAEKISILPTNSDLWNNVNVTVLQKPVQLTLKRVSSSGS